MNHDKLFEDFNARSAKIQGRAGMIFGIVFAFQILMGLVFIIMAGTLVWGMIHIIQSGTDLKDFFYFLGELVKSFKEGAA